MLAHHVEEALQQVEKMGEVVDLSSYFKQKTWYNKRFLEASNLVEKYAEEYQKTGSKKKFRQMQTWWEIMEKMAYELDKLDGSL